MNTQLKLQDGKTYHLIDKYGYLNHHPANRIVYKKHFKNDCIILDNINYYGGCVDVSGERVPVIYHDEIKYFEEL